MREALPVREKTRSVPRFAQGAKRSDAMSAYKDKSQHR